RSPAGGAARTHDDVFLEDLVLSKRLAPRTEEVDRVGDDIGEKNLAKTPEIIAGGEASRRDRHHRPVLSEETGHDGQENRVNVRLAVHDRRGCNRPRVILRKFE